MEKELGVYPEQPPTISFRKRSKRMLRFQYCISALLLLLLGNVLANSFEARSKAGPFPDLYEASVEDLQQGLDAGHFTSVDLVKVRPIIRFIFLSQILKRPKAYFARIDEVNLKGPALRAVLEMNPSALSQAADLDKERKIKENEVCCMVFPSS
jgi:amidase